MGWPGFNCFSSSYKTSMIHGMVAQNLYYLLFGSVFLWWEKSIQVISHQMADLKKGYYAQTEKLKFCYWSLKIDEINLL